MVAEEAGKAVPWLNTGSNTKVAKPQIFYGTSGKVLEFITTCKLFLRMRMREVAVKKQIQ